MGEKIVLTELIAYGSLGELINNNLISKGLQSSLAMHCVGLLILVLLVFKLAG